VQGAASSEFELFGKPHPAKKEETEMPGKAVIVSIPRALGWLPGQHHMPRSQPLDVWTITLICYWSTHNHHQRHPYLPFLYYYHQTSHIVIAFFSSSSENKLEINYYQDST
jgi:hypothetical protein